MASLLTLPDELLCHIADYCVQQPYEPGYSYPSLTRPCGPSRPLLQPIKSCKRLYQLLRSRLYHTTEIALRPPTRASSAKLAQGTYSRVSLLKVPSRAVTHAVLDWQFDESLHSKASISRYCKDLFGTSALSRCQHVTLKDFNFDSISADFAKLLSSKDGTAMSSITILWTGTASKRYRHGLGAFLGNISPRTTGQILAYGSAPDESVDGPVDYAYHLSEFEGTDLSVFSYEDIPFGVGWISRLVNLSINTQHVPSIVAVVKEAGMNLLNLQGLHVSDNTHGCLFELDAEIEMADLLQCVPNLRRCNVTLNDMSYETTAVLDALSPDIEDLTFSSARLDADIVDFIRFVQNNGLPKLRRLEANIQ